MSTISTVAAADRLDVSYRQVNHWVTKGYIKPLGGGGSGRPQFLDWRELTVLTAMVGLVKSGVRPEDAAKMARGDRGAISQLDAALTRCRDMQSGAA